MIVSAASPHRLDSESVNTPAAVTVNAGADDPFCHSIVVSASAVEVRVNVMPSHNVVSAGNTGVGGTPEMSTTMVSVADPQLLFTSKMNTPDCVVVKLSLIHI